MSRQEEFVKFIDELGSNEPAVRILQALLKQPKVSGEQMLFSCHNFDNEGVLEKVEYPCDFFKPEVNKNRIVSKSKYEIIDDCYIEIALDRKFKNNRQCLLELVEVVNEFKEKYDKLSNYFGISFKDDLYHTYAMN